MFKNSIKLALTTALILSISYSEDYGSVNGEKITQEDIEQVIGTQGVDFKTFDANMKKKVLNMIVDRKLLSQEAQNSGVDKTKEFKERLEDAKKDIAFGLWMDEEAKKIESNTTEEELKEFYKNNINNFVEPAQLKARHILVKTEQEAKDIIKDLDNAKDKKAEFIKLAKEKSTGPSGANGGDLGWFPLDRMVPEFSNAANKLKKGTYTKEPVKTQFGYHIIYLEDRKPEHIKKFEEVKEQIKELVNSNKFNKFVDKKIKELRTKAKIELKD